MPDWVPHIAEVIVLAFIAWERSHARRDITKLVTSSIRPPPPRCYHDNPIVIRVGICAWCGHCGAFRVGNAAWKNAGDRDNTPPGE